MKKTSLRLNSAIACLLLSACDSTTKPLSYPQADSASAQIFLQKCGGCHVAPEPGSRSARAWSTVVQRMQMRMRAKGMPPLNNEEMTEVLDYLQRHAAQAGMQ